ncbi:MAG: hypothetical protein P8R42_08740 [Candidatus Binatia bacterium]|nr:hypothetical protein [Candidatus Binatia bacterium]
MRSVTRMLLRGIPSFTVAAAFTFVSATALSGVVQPEPVSVSVQGTSAVAAMPQAEFGHELESRLLIERDERASLDLGPDAALQLGVRSRFESEAIVKYAVELVDEFGFEIESPVGAPVFSVPAGESAPVEIELPDSLGEGFYLVRVTLVGRAGDESADDIMEQGIAVVDGEAVLLSDEEWLEYSYANGGY